MPLKDSFGFWDYVKAAFHLKVRLRSLGHLPLNKLLLAGFAILAVGHPGFLFLGLAYEAAYLMSLSGSQRFQRLVQGREYVAWKEGEAARQHQALQALEDPARSRYRHLESLCTKILTNSGLASTRGLGSLQMEELNQLLAIFLRLLQAQQAASLLLGQVSESELCGEISRTEERLGREPEEGAVQRSLAGTLEIQKRRLGNRQRIKESLKVTEAELDRIEKQVTLISEETAVGGDPQILSQRLDGVIRSLDEAQKWIADSSQLLATIEGEAAPAMPRPQRRGQKE